MIMLSKLIESVSVKDDRRIHGDGWMDKNNVIHDVSGQGHLRWANDYLYSNKIAVTRGVGVYNQMFKLGFVRIVYCSLENIIHIEYGPASGIKPKQLKELKDITVDQKASLFDDVIKYSLVKNGNDITEFLHLKNILR